MWSVEEIRASYDSRFAAHPRGAELWGLYEDLSGNKQYLDHLRQLQAFKNGLDPLPDRDSVEDLLRKVGHDFAALDGLRTGSTLWNLLHMGHINLEAYTGLHATVVARLMSDSAPLTAEGVARVYDTIDRLIRGGSAWYEVTTVPAVTRDVYRGLAKVKVPLSVDIASWLEDLLEIRTVKCVGDEKSGVHSVAWAAIQFLTVASPHRNGRSRATADDAVDAAFAYVSLFDSDPYTLPSLIRTGQTGYELVG